MEKRVVFRSSPLPYLLVLPHQHDVDVAAEVQRHRLAEAIMRARLAPDVQHPVCGGRQPPRLPSQAAHVIMIDGVRSEEHTSELQSLMRISYAVFCLKTKKDNQYTNSRHRYSY